MYQLKNWKLICEEKDREIARLKEELERVKRVERLTDEDTYCAFVDCDYEGCRINCYDKKLYDKLKEYEVLEEQGLLLKLPCKEGDVVYYPSEYWKRVFEYAVIGICVYTEDIWIKCGNGYSYILGREIFLTKAEAEKALAEMEE